MEMKHEWRKQSGETFRSNIYKLKVTFCRFIATETSECFSTLLSPPAFDNSVWIGLWSMRLWSTRLSRPGLEYRLSGGGGVPMMT